MRMLRHTGAGLKAEQIDVNIVAHLELEWGYLSSGIAICW
jgi:hypothetical protein